MHHFFGFSGMVPTVYDGEGGMREREPGKRIAFEM